MATGSQEKRVLVTFGVNLYPEQMDYIKRVRAIFGMSKSNAVRYAIDRLQEAERELYELRNATIWQYAKDTGISYVDAMNQVAAEWVEMQRQRMEQEREQS